MNRVRRIGGRWVVMSAIVALGLTTLAAQSNFMGGTPSRVPSDKISTLRLKFPKGSRSNWHSHSWGQLLMVEEGHGLTQDRGGAVRKIDEDTVEIKRMYVVREVRGRGIAGQVLRALEQEAKRLGARAMVLETGERQAEALALYKRAGYVRIEPFGEYVDSPLSVCMKKAL